MIKYKNNSFETESIKFLNLNSYYISDMRIPESKIEEIRNSASIVDIISEYVHLRKRGKNYIGFVRFIQKKRLPLLLVMKNKFSIALAVTLVEMFLSFYGL